MTILTSGVPTTGDTRGPWGFGAVARGVVVLLLAVGCLLTAARAATPPLVTPPPPAATRQPAIVATCRKDLAQRRNIAVTAVTVIDVQATVWPNAALGLPERDKVYAQVQTPGWRIVLEAGRERYLYTASARTCKFGGPVSLWCASMLYLRPVADDANLNHDLYQCALVGTNHTRLMYGVDSYFPQDNGVVLFTRRTSRSGYDLLSMTAGSRAPAQRLYSAFFIGGAALNATQDTWAAFVRPSLGGGWHVAVARGGLDKAVLIPLPDHAQPERIAWSEAQVMILARTEKGTACFATLPTAAAPVWTALDRARFPGALDYLLNKSESLEITQTGTEAKPAVEVARVWFTGDRNVIATITGLTLRGDMLLAPDAGYVFLWGEQLGQPAAYTVRLATGEVTPGFRGAYRDPKPFVWPPLAKP